MKDEPISSAVRSLITGHVRSVGDLECLLLLQSDPAREWCAAEIGRELRIDDQWATKQLAEFLRSGLVVVVESSAPPRYRYAPATLAMKDAVCELATHYASRRVTVIELIYSRPADPVQSFADAFRLRKERGDG